jgi:TfoX/Sxy family transcriptional regulator of competence genes
MAHDPLFEQRIGNALTDQGAKAEPKKMFGGVAFMVRGHMTVGITNKGDFMVRFDAARHAEVSQWPGAKPMTYGKGDMKGFLFVDAAAVNGKAALDKWVKLALAHNSAQPAKSDKKPAKKPAANGRKAK